MCGGIKTRKYYINIKLHRNPISDTSYMCEFKMVLFEKGKLKEFLLFQSIFQITLDASETITEGVKISIYVLCYMYNIFVNLRHCVQILVTLPDHTQNEFFLD